VPLPVGLSTVTVSGTYKHPNGSAMQGKLLFTPEPSILTSGTHGTLVLGTVEATLDANGAVSATLLATDDADVTPVGWTYLVQERWYDAPGRSYPLSLPSAAPTVDLADVAPTAPAEGVYVVVTGPQGPPGSNADAEAYTDAAVATHTADSTAVHGIADTTALETAAGATAKVSAHAAASDPHGDRSWASGIFATITALNTTNGTVITLNGYLDDIFARLAAIEGGTAFLGGVNSTGPVRVIGADLSIEGTGKGYRLRRGGGGLDLEACGADLILSNWSGADFSGTQRSYDRYSADAMNVQHAGKREFVSALYGATRHVIDGTADQLGFHGKAPVSQQAVTGSRGGNAALASLLTALDTLGIIDDQTTA